MNKINFIAIIFLCAAFTGCKNGAIVSDATGTFEADEVIVSSELSGKILSFKVQEGLVIAKDSIVGTVDAKNISLQQDQVEASIKALSEKTATAAPQVQLLQNQLAVQQSQLNNLQHERKRMENLVKADAATGKQLDDITAQVDVARRQLAVTKQQINVQRSNTNTQNRSILSEADPLRKRVAQLQDQAQRASIVNPVSGTVITKYAEEGEITAAGKALYKIADLSSLNLKKINLQFYTMLFPQQLFRPALHI